MKGILMLVMLGVIGGLWVDDNSKRHALEQAQAQINQDMIVAGQVDGLLAERNQLRFQLEHAGVAVPSPASTPTWFQQRINEKPDLESASKSSGKY